MADQQPPSASHNNATDDEDSEEEKLEAPSGGEAAAAAAGGGGVSVLPVDWTQLAPKQEEHIIRYPEDVMTDELLETDDELILVGTHGQKVTHMGKDLDAWLLSKMSVVKKRSMR